MESDFMDLDEMLKELGQFGWFQILYFCLLLFPMTLDGFRCFEYVFTTMDIPHRCRVPECEGASESAGLDPPWLSNAVPLSIALTPQPCLRYHPIHNSSLTNTTYCPADLFNSSITEKCSEWVFGESTRTIATDFGILCPPDYWKRTMLGSLSLISNIIGMPLAGMVSDWLGRKNTLIGALMILCITGILRSFSPNYAFLAALETFDGFLTGGTFAPAFILGLETLAPSKRLLGIMVINMYNVVGAGVLSLAMWMVEDWRMLLRVFYIPMLAVGVEYWIMPESLRWLYTKGRYEEVEAIFVKIASLNNTKEKLPDVIRDLHTHKNKGMLKDNNTIHEVKVKEPIKTFRFSAVFKSQIIICRLIVCALCWVAAILTYYGISQYSATYSQDRYFSFFLVSLVELPAYIAILWVPNWPSVGRRGCNSWAFFLGGAACLANAFIKPDQYVLKLVLSLAAKFFFTLTVAVIYMYTAELFPTELRNSLLSICSTVGRFGQILSQQTPLISGYVDPLYIFGAVAVVGGVLTLGCPETLNTKLPDTIEEAENIGRKEKKVEL